MRKGRGDGLGKRRGNEISWGDEIEGLQENTVQHRHKKRSKVEGT